MSVNQPRSGARCTAFVKLAALAALCVAGLVACSDDSDKRESGLASPSGKLLGEDRSATGGGDSISAGVNAFLWRGALDTLAFMPFTSTDAVGGAIITDWYSPPASHGERFKIMAYILSSKLKSDALRVSVFRQTRQQGSCDEAWVDAPVDKHIASDIASKILIRARQLRTNGSGI